MDNLEQVVTEALFERVEILRGRERECLARIVLYLAEIDRRGVYRERGYSSLFVYCRDGLGYAEASAYRRVQAARALRKHPEIYEKLRDGRLNLHSVCEVMKVSDGKSRGELLDKVEGKSRTEVERIIAPLKPAVPAPIRERVVVQNVVASATFDQGDLFSNPTLKDHEKVQKDQKELSYHVSFSADKEFMDLVARVRALVPEYQAEMKRVFERALREYEKRHSPVEREKRRKQRKRLARRKSKSVSAAVRDQVFVRDGAQCSFVSNDGVRCRCREQLEIDHIRPKGLGGSNEPGNLRLLCRAHNQLAAERVYGREFMEGKMSKSKLSSRGGRGGNLVIVPVIARS